MKHRISPATVIASVALFFSLGGVGYAAAHHWRITSVRQIKPSVVRNLTRERTRTVTADHLSADMPQSPTASGFAASGVSCPRGYRVVGGGFISPQYPAQGSSSLVEDSPSGNGWYVEILNHGTTPITFKATAVCAR